MSHCAVIPVIHHLDDATTLAEADLAFRCGADGVFLIAHGAGDDVLPDLVKKIEKKHSNWFVGMNLLSEAPLAAVERAINMGVAGVWLDKLGVSSAGLNEEGEAIKKLHAQHPWLKIFAAVASKNQPFEIFPAQAAEVARANKFIPTASGAETAIAPSVKKISIMAEATQGQLAVAGGMTCENVPQFSPYLSWILVASGISRDAHHLDEDKTREFIKIVGNTQRVQ